MIQPEKTSKYAVVVSLLTLCFIACNGKASEISNHSSNPIVTIERFDKELPSYVQETDSAKIFLFIDKYTPFFPVYCRHILGLGRCSIVPKGIKNVFIQRGYIPVVCGYRNKIFQRYRMDYRITERIPKIQRVVRSTETSPHSYPHFGTEPVDRHNRYHFAIGFLRLLFGRKLSPL